MSVSVFTWEKKKQNKTIAPLSFYFEPYRFAYRSIARAVIRYDRYWAPIISVRFWFVQRRTTEAFLVFSNAVPYRINRSLALRWSLRDDMSLHSIAFYTPDIVLCCRPRRRPRRREILSPHTGGPADDCTRRASVLGAIYFPG